MSRPAGLHRLVGMRVSVSNLVRVQAIAGVAFAVFLTAHLANQLLAVAGPGTYDHAQGALRTLYQWPPFEVVFVVAGFVVHVASGLWLRRLRRSSARVQRPLRHRLHTWSGMFLLVFATVQHIPAVRGSSLFFATPPHFDGIAFALVWQPAYYLPYYVLLGAAGAYHLVSGLALALPRLGLRALRFRLSDHAVLLSGVVATLAVAVSVGAFYGAWFPIADPTQGPYAQLLIRLGIASP